MLASRLSVLAALLGVHVALCPAAAPPHVLQPAARLGSADAIQSFALGPDGKTMSLTPWDGPTHLVDLATRKRTALGSPRGARMTGDAAYSNDGKRLALGGDHIAVVDGRTGKLVRAFPVRAGFVQNLVFSPDGTRLAGIRDDPSRGEVPEAVVVYDIKSGREVGRLRHPTAVRTILWSADGKTLVTGSLGVVDLPDTVKVWDARTFKERYTLGGNAVRIEREQCGSDVALSPDGRTLVTGVSILDPKSTTSPLPFYTVTKIVRVDIVLRDAATGKPRATLRSHPGTHVEGLAYSPDGKLLATAVDGVVRLWDPVSARPVAAVPRLAASGEVVQMAFSADGRRLGVLRGDTLQQRWGSEVQVWDVAAVRKAYGR